MFNFRQLLLGLALAIISFSPTPLPEEVHAQSTTPPFTGAEIPCQPGQQTPSGTLGDQLPCVSQTQGVALQLTPCIGNRQPGVSCAGEGNRWVFQIFGFSLGLVNIAAIVAIVFLAFSQVLKPAWSAMAAYEIKKSLPQLIIGVILANFSLLILRFLVDIGNALTILAIGDGGFRELGAGVAQAMLLGDTYNSAAAGALLGSATAISILALLGVVGAGIGLLAVFFAFVLMFLPGILIFVLALLLFIRPPVIYFLAAIAPLAFASLGLPAGQTIFKKWWQYAINWIFMLPAVFLLLSIVAKLGSSQGNLWTWAAAIVLFIIAIRLPFRMGGDIMNMWYRGMKGAGALAGGMYGGAMARMSKWAPQPGEKLESDRQRIGLIARKANIFALKQAYTERKQAEETFRLGEARKSIAYRGVAGRKAMIRHYLEEAVKESQGIQNLKRASARIKKLDPENKLGALSEEDLADFMYGPPDTTDKIAKRLGIDPESAARLQKIHQKGETLLRRRGAQRSAKESYNRMRTDPRPWAESGVEGEPEAYGGARVAGLQPNPLDQVYESEAVRYARDFGMETGTAHDLLDRIRQGANTENLIREFGQGATGEGTITDTALAARFGRSVNQSRDALVKGIGELVETETDELYTIAINPKVKVNISDAQVTQELERAYQGLTATLRKGDNPTRAIELAMKAYYKLHPDVEVSSRLWQQDSQKAEEALRRALVLSRAGDISISGADLKAKVKIAAQTESMFRDIGSTFRDEVGGKSDSEAITKRVEKALQDSADPLRIRLQEHLDLVAKVRAENPVNVESFLKGITEKAKGVPGDLTDSVTLWSAHDAAKKEPPKA